MVNRNETLSDETSSYTNATEGGTGFAIANFVFSTEIGTTIATHKTPVVYLAGAIIVGAIGFLANGSVFTLLCFRRKSERNVCHALIHNQTAIDFSASSILIAMYAVKTYGVHLTGTLGRAYCKLFDSDAIFACGMHGSTGGLMVITFERYIKIVHPFLYQSRYRNWMKYAGIMFPWLYSVLITFPFLMATSDISNGKCLPLTYWSADWLKLFYGVGTPLWKLVLPMAIFFFCYTRILLLIKEQSKFHESSTSGQNILPKSERRVVKIMLLVVACFVCAYAPSTFYYLAAAFQLSCCASLDSNSYYIVVWIFYLNTVVNPFLYSANSEIVRSVFRKICKRQRHKEEESRALPYTIDISITTDSTRDASDVHSPDQSLATPPPPLPMKEENLTETSVTL